METKSRENPVGYQAVARVGEVPEGLPKPESGPGTQVEGLAPEQGT